MLLVLLHSIMETLDTLRHFGKQSSWIKLCLLTDVSLSVTLISNSVIGLSSPSSTIILLYVRTGKESSTGINLILNVCDIYNQYYNVHESKNRLCNNRDIS